MSTQTAATRTTAQIRQDFIDYFVAKHGHTFAPSSPVAPHDDPTLLFTNAGMNQFKDVFLAQGERGFTRAVNSQKCIRAGGKHNDLEDVGKDHYHHTFFEMLGNWSFGDYFKSEAIEWAWDLLTNVWGLDANRLYVTVFEGAEAEGTEPDEEAANIWRKYVPADRISYWGKKDNFWEMGATGPCGPCSEIHYDFTDDLSGAKLVNLDDPRVVELWNLVFIQFNRGDDGALTPLPAKHVDTGMGLERISRVLQGVDSNYDTDLFTPIFKAIQSHTGAHPYQGALEDPTDIAYRVIADHIRCLTVAITDGARPSNEGRGYVLRRILRRAVRHAHQTLQTKGAWLYELVPSVVESLGCAFPGLTEKPDKIAEVIRDEEEGFLRTLDRGIEYWWTAAGSALDELIRDERTEIHSNQLDQPERYLWKEEWGDPEAKIRDQVNQGYPPGFEVGPLDHNSRIRIVEWKDGACPELYRGTLEQITKENLRHFRYPPRIVARDAFKLHDTYGFPIDLTRIMAEERGMTVDEEGYEKLMDEARQRSRRTSETEGGVDLMLPPDALAKLKYMKVQPTLDGYKFAAKPLSAEIAAIWNGTDFDNHTSLTKPAAIICNRTNHYAEAGGQVGDVGSIQADVVVSGTIPVRGYSQTESKGDGRFEIHNTRSVGGFILHHGVSTDGKLHVGDRVTITVDHDKRDATRANHTATHLLNFALREVVGPEEDQKGSLVAPDRLRFDFSCSHAMNAEQVASAERIVNELIEQASVVYDDVIPLAQAKSINGLRAVFGEKYPDPVRVVCIGASLEEVLADPGDEKWKAHSLELCGGTHLLETSEAKRFLITNEQALAAGVRRIIALTGPAAMAADAAGRGLESRAVGAADLPDDRLAAEFDEITALIEGMSIGVAAQHRVEQLLEPLRDRLKALRRQEQAHTRAGAVDQARAIAAQSSGPVIVAKVTDADRDSLLAAMDVVRAKHAESAVMLFNADTESDKVAIVARVPEAMIARGLKAGDWVRQAAQQCGGKGGGRPDMAQAGGSDIYQIPAAITAARVFAENALQ